MKGLRNSCILIVSVLLLVGCSHKMGEFTLISTKNYDSSLKYRYVGRYSGSDRVFFLFFAWGEPSIKDAVDDVLEEHRGTYLANAVLENVSAPFSFGYRITGDVFAPAYQSELNDPSIEKYNLIKRGDGLVMKCGEKEFPVTN